jgi:predicted permease
MNSRFNEIGPGYFQTVGMKLLAGREFSRADALGGRKVAIVNEAFAKKFKLGRAVVGTHIGNRGRALDTEIVGLVKDAKYSSVKQVPPPLFFRPYRQDEEVGFLTFYVRTTLPEERVFGAIRGVMRRLDPNLPVEHLKTMATQVRENTFADRIVTTFATAFALLATLLAAVGLYGVLAYTIAQRTREIGLRMALGADAARVRRMVMTQVAWMTLIGGGIGLAAALGIGRVARALLFELEGHDPAVLAAATITLALVAIGAGLLPAQKASRISPIQALRCE